MVLFQPVAGDALHGLVAIAPPLVLEAELLNGVPEQAKRAAAMDSVCQHCAAIAVVLSVGEVLHHSPLINVRAIGQLQHALVVQRPLDLGQELTHPNRRALPIAAFSDARFFFIEGDDLARVGIEIGAQLIALEVESFNNIAQ